MLQIITDTIARIRGWFYPLKTNGGLPPWEGGDAAADDRGSGADGRSGGSISETMPPSVIAMPAVAKPKPAPNPDAPGEFYFREAILDQLDHYFVVLRRMRLGDHHAYALYRQVGAHLLPYNNPLFDRTGPLSPWFLEHRPSFGAVAQAIDPRSRKYEDRKNVCIPRFMYFQKYKPAKVPPGLQRVNHGDVYVMTIYWDKPGDDIWKKSGAPTEFGVQVSDDGEVKLLLSHCREHVRTHTKRGHDWFSIPQQRWGIAKFFQEWAREHKRDPVEHMKSLFFQTTSAFEKAQGLVRVNVGKDEMHAVFSVNVKRTPYFFKDRDVTVTESGRKQRIFHIVREHVRQLEDKEVTVREHFRGLRKFKWNGYQLHITVPGLHHEKIAEFNPAAEDEDANTPLPPGMVTVPIAARMLRDLISGVPIEEARARMKKGLQ